MLIGERVVLRARRRSDLARLQPVVRDDVETVALMDDEPWLPRSLEGAQARFDEQLSDEPPSNRDSLVVQCRDDPGEQAVGTAGLWGLDLHARLAHVAQVVAREARGSGLGALGAVRLGLSDPWYAPAAGGNPGRQRGHDQGRSCGGVHQRRGAARRRLA